MSASEIAVEAGDVEALDKVEREEVVVVKFDNVRPS